MKSELSNIEADYKRLLDLHRSIFLLEDPKLDLTTQLLSDSVCRIPRKNTSSIKMVHKPYGIAICLPPKCGTTNWQKAMTVLENDVEKKPSPSGSKYWKPEELKCPACYGMLKNADISNHKDMNLISDWTKILNSRQGYKNEFSI